MEAFVIQGGQRLEGALRVDGAKNAALPILAACVLTVLPELMRGFDDLRMVMYSLVLIVMMLFRPEGLLGSYDFSMSRLIEKAVTKLKGGRKA